jgi:tripartite-type tricarboxylate transporter receptor subunit TctC
MIVHLFKSLPAERVSELVPVGLMCVGTPFVFAANPSVTFKSISELIAQAKPNPGTISYAIAYRACRRGNRPVLQQASGRVAG